MTRNTYKRMVLILLAACMFPFCRKQETPDPKNLDQKMKYSIEFERTLRRGYSILNFGFLSSSKAWFSEIDSDNNIIVYVYDIGSQKFESVLKTKTTRTQSNCPIWIFPVERGRSWLILNDYGVVEACVETQNSEVKLLQVDNGKPVSKGSIGCLWNAQLHGTRIIAISESGDFVEIDPRSGMVLNLKFINDAGRLGEFRISEDGKYLAHTFLGLSVLNTSTGSQSLKRIKSTDYIAEPISFLDSRHFIVTKKEDEQSFGWRDEYELRKIEVDGDRDDLLLFSQARLIDLAAGDSRTVFFVTEKNEICKVSLSDIKHRSDKSSPLNIKIFGIFRYNKQIVDTIKCASLIYKPQQMRLSPDFNYIFVKSENGRIQILSGFR